MEQAVRRWPEEITRNREDILRIGYFGSYARGGWGVGSDLDLIVVLKGSNKPFEQRGADFDTISLPVPVDLLVYTKAEWMNLDVQGRFYRTLLHETVLIFEAG